jgi:hypothetical protein
MRVLADAPDCREVLLQLACVNGFDEPAPRSLFERLLANQVIWKTGNEDDRQHMPQIAEPTLHLDAGGARHLHIRYNARHVGKLLVFQKIIGRTVLTDLPAERPDKTGVCDSHCIVIFYNGNDWSVGHVAFPSIMLR